MLLHRYSYTETPLHRETCLFTRKYFYREMILHWAIWHRNQNKQRCFYRGMHVHKGLLSTGIFTQTYYWIISCGGRAYGAKSSESTCKITVSPQLLMVETHFVGKGWPRTNPHCNLTSMYDDRHVVRQGCVSWTSIHTALPLEEKK